MTTVKRRGPGFLLDLVVVTVLASPLWFGVSQRGVRDAVISGAVTAVLFSVSWHFIHDETPGDRLAGWLAHHRGV